MLDRARSVYGVARSLALYHGNRRRFHAMTALYRALVPPGCLTFDIGSHVGDRVVCLRRLGARVVALEPQAALARTLRTLFRHDLGVVVYEVALGAREGTTQMHLNLVNPTVSSASVPFIVAAAGAAGWRDQRWTQVRTVPVLTLDGLIARHGAPGFVKIDVEGMEADVLAGLSQPVPLLSFEFTTIQRGVALESAGHCRTLGDYRFNAVLGEEHRLLHPRWLSHPAICNWLQALPDSANSGDVYACLAPARIGTD